MMKYTKLQQVLSLITCVLMLLAVAINKNQQVLGHELNGKSEKSEKNTSVPTEQAKNNGTVVISTQEIAKDVKGYGGTTPLEISLKGGKITDIKPLKNAETPNFFERLAENGMYDKWIGLSVDEALQLKVDAVSGATLSSKAVITNVQRGLQYAKDTQTETPAIDFSAWLSPKFICALLVILAAAILPLFVRSQRYRVVQLVLNVIVLGFWSGSFISYSLMVNYLSNGVNILIAAIPLLMLVLAFIYPLFGKKNHYCMWVCPLGSMQELAGKCVKRKANISPVALKYLNYFKMGLWSVLMLFLWSGVCFKWMDYELFTAFLFRQASVVVIVVAVLFILLSFVVNRPYCRFVCPTGFLFRISQNSK